jgi:hypothetical protein
VSFLFSCAYVVVLVSVMFYSGYFERYRDFSSVIAFLLYNCAMFGPVSDASHNSIGITTTQTTILLVCVGLLAGILYWRHRRRANAIRALANRLGFTYMGKSLPLSVTVRGTALERLGSAWNVIQGKRHDVGVIAFDCRIGMGKTSWRRTVIAAQTDADIFGTVKFNRDLTVERSGSWMFLYEPKAVSLIPSGLMSVDEIEAHLNTIVAPASG